MEAKAQAMGTEAHPVAADEGAEMLARHLAGEPRAFGELVERYGSSVFGYLRRSGLANHVAEDMFQETFLRVHQHARRYDPNRPFQAWLMPISHNLVRSHFRKAKVRRVLVGWFGHHYDPPDPKADVLAKVECRDQARLLEQALAELPDGSRRALILTQVEGLSQQETANILAVPLPTIKTWIRRGRLQLAEALAEQEEGA